MTGATAINPAVFAEHLMAGETALSDPNQPPPVRWGLANPTLANCEIFY
jgi:hypothetical protein